MHACNKISEKEAMSQKESKEGLEGRNVINAIEKIANKKTTVKKMDRSNIKKELILSHSLRSDTFHNGRKTWAQVCEEAIFLL